MPIVSQAARFSEIYKASDAAMKAVNEDNLLEH